MPPLAEEAWVLKKAAAQIMAWMALARSVPRAAEIVRRCGVAAAEDAVVIKAARHGLVTGPRSLA